MEPYEAEQLRLQKLMEEVFADEEIDGSHFDDESDETEDDVVEHVVHESETEQEISADEQNVDNHSTALSYVGKDATTRWKKHPPQSRSFRTRQENLIRRLPGPSMETKNLKQLSEIWAYFMNDQIIEIIVNSTNQYIESIVENYSNQNHAKSTNPNELKALIGLLYLAGIYKSNHQNTSDMWRTDGHGIEIFRLTMSQQRFRFLLQCIRFDNRCTRLERKKQDKFALIREVFEIFVAKCEKGYNLSAFVTIDEMLAAFRGRCSFRQYIPSKPNKYGLKILALCDAKMLYTSKLECYLGKQPEGPYFLSNSPKEVVLRLCQHISQSGRNVTMDNWFTSVPLFHTLLAEHKLTAIGTIRKNKREIPVEFAKPAQRPLRTSMFGFGQHCTLLSYIPKKNKNVLLISSLHHTDEIDNQSGDLLKPEIITEYNRTKGGVDIVDQLCANYNCARNTRRWPMVIFYVMLNVAGINSQVIYTANNPENKLLRRQFLRNLADDLIRPQLQARAALTNIPRPLKLRLFEICNIGEAQPQAVGSISRCAYCD